MPLTHGEATNALHDIEQAKHRSSVAYGYQRASPHLIVWGVIWIAGYGISYVHPQWSLVWCPLVALGLVASFWIGYRSRARMGRRGLDVRHLYTLVAIAAFIAAQFTILKPTAWSQLATYFPILVALFYTLLGIWVCGLRMVLLGVAVAVLTFTGYFWIQPWFLLWMAVVGGGGLILGGLWLKTV